MIEARAASGVDRPADDSPPDWRVHHVEGNWQLSKVPMGREVQSSGRSPGEGLTTDWRAENTGTGEVREFTQTAELDVWFDLLGIRPFDRTLHQERMEEAARDTVQTREGLRRMFRMQREHPGDAGRVEAYRALVEADDIPKMPQVRVVELLKGAHVPVYGPAGRPFGLELHSVYCNIYHRSRTGHIRPQTGSASFEFVNHPAVDEDPARNEAYLSDIRRRLIEERAASRQSKPGTNWVSWIGTDAGQVEKLPRKPPEPPPVSTKALTLASLYNLTYTTPRARSSDAGSSWLDDEPPGFDDATKLYHGLAAEVREHLAPYESEELCKQVDGFIWGFAPDFGDEIVASGEQAQLMRRRFVLEGTEFEGTVLYWPGPELQDRCYALCAFRLEYVEVPPIVACVVGGTFGIGLGECISLLEQLVVVNDRAELLAEYQAQLEAQIKRWRS